MLLSPVTVLFRLVTVVPWPVTAVLRPATVVLKLVSVTPWLVTDVFNPVTVVFNPVTVVPSAVAAVWTVPSVLLVVLRLLARLVTWLMAIGSVAYCVEPDPPPLNVLPPPVPSVLVCRTAASVSAVVLGGTCQVSVQDAVPLLLV